MEKKKQQFDIIEKIYNGELIYCDKKNVNKEVDKLYNEVAVIWEENDTKVVENLVDKFSRIISLIEIEAFARGASFMEELKKDIDKVFI